MVCVGCKLSTEACIDIASRDPSINEDSKQFLYAFSAHAALVMYLQGNVLVWGFVAPEIVTAKPIAHKRADAPLMASLGW